MMRIQLLLKAFLVLLLSVSAVYGQKNFSVLRKNKVFFGAYGGVNFSLVDSKEDYHVLTRLSDDDPNGLKEYDKLFDNRASQFGFQIMYGFSKHFSLVLQPGFYNYHFRYGTSYAWLDTVEQMNFAKELKFENKLSYFTIPLAVRWDFLKSRFSPYLQLGAYVDFRYKATKAVYMDGVIDQDVDVKNADLMTAKVDVRDHFQKVNYGVMGGLGFSYFTKYFVIGLEFNYRMQLSKLVNDRARYADETGFSTQFLDVYDKLSLSNVNAQLSFVFPISSMQYLNILRRTKY